MTAAIVNIITLIKIASKWTPSIKFSSWSGIYHLENVVGLASVSFIIKLYYY